MSGLQEQEKEEIDMGTYSELRTRYEEMANNRSIRVLICLCIDSSYSMAERMKSLNRGVQEFLEGMCQNILAVDATEICIVSFGDKVKVECPFDNVRKAVGRKIYVNGSETRLGAGVKKSLEEIDRRLKELTGQLCYLPWLIIISDGDATDVQECQEVSRAVRSRLQTHKLKVKCLSMGDGSRNLKDFTLDGKVDRLEDLDVMDFFSMLSRSVSQVSQESINHGEFELEG